MKSTRWSLIVTACLFLIGTVQAGGIDRLPDQTMLWNRFHAVTVVDSFAVALAPEGIVVCRFDRVDSSFVQVNQLFLDDEPVRMKPHGDMLVVYTMTDSLLLIDIGQLPSIDYRAGIDVGLPLSDFALHGDDLYVSAWFAGILRFTVDDDDQISFSDSSMKPILVTQVEVSNDTLYGLDEYNGIIRYDISGDGFGQFIDYLYIPQRAASFLKIDTEFIIPALNDGILFGQFGQAGSGIYGSIDGTVPIYKTLLTDSLFIFVGDRFVELIDRSDYQQRSTIAIGDDPPDGDLFYIDDSPLLLLPGQFGGLVLYHLDESGQSWVAFYRPGPITGLVLRDGRLYTGGETNPVDVYRLDWWRTSPRLDFTIYSALQDVVSIDHNGDSLIVLYNSLNKIAFISSIADPDEYYLESSIFVDPYGAFDLEFTTDWATDQSAILVYAASSISVYPINDSDFAEHGATWPIVGGVLGATFADSLLFVSTGKNSIRIYRIAPDYSLSMVSSIDLAIPAFELKFMNDRLIYFTHDDMTYVDCSDPHYPRVEAVVPMALPVTDGVVYEDRFYTVGERGLAVYDLDTSPPTVIDYGGRAGSFLATDGEVVATSNGESIHLYYLHEDRPFHVESGPPVPNRFQLSQNYPNPFNPTTFIDFSLPQPVHVRVDVFNVLGQIVKTLVDESQPAGHHTVSWNGTDVSGDHVSSGVYFYRISADDFAASNKMMLIR